jgi:hypothetical protein
MSTQQIPGGRCVEAVLTFNEHGFDGSVVDDANRANSITRFENHSVIIHDLRGREDNVSLAKNGFQALRHTTRCRNFTDEREVRELYYPDMEALVRQLTGAPHVTCYGHIVRSKLPDAPPNARTPAGNVHVDNDFETLRQMAQALAPAAHREECLRGRQMLINLWRPIRTVQKDPLAVMDGATVRRANLHPVRLLSSRAHAKNPHGFNVSHDPLQRWYYLSQMRPDEVLAFKQIDTQPDAVQWAGHTAFADPTSPPDAEERQSIEIRAVAYLPWIERT